MSCAGLALVFSRRAPAGTIFSIAPRRTWRRGTTWSWTKLKSVGAIAYFEKSKLLGDVNSSSLLDAVKEALGTRAGGHRGFKVACENC